ncbi:hypothetical protein FJ434_19455 [Mesorhizobium sp. B2-5-13]|uniref:hypothetical protein n=1 Tax=unclassified Mesorhizobium TaxID=325217 RepID=UPI0011281142|nr:MULTISPECIES: hypothetical protein [unclassified Mesorhizobium]TPJ40800.1 hypothetical protein FJ432_15110 [Mesorhizobium sp. B2-6-5]TPJ40817.1 hypothetical protein FJ432_15215 [Mesorhizobium sp. B2-6-5]TPJ83745.1 hypothetical protein FJ434_19455 [Mesorhizobium sp. B2-5-13]TPK47950.1 hypothetical protein FJ560_15735 [Mesorhizobium sp. B2-5-5]
MTLTFTAHESPISQRNGNMSDMPASDTTPAMGDGRRAWGLPRRLWRIVSALSAQLPGRRRPPEGDYLRRDIGLPEREELPHYWDFTRL